MAAHRGKFFSYLRVSTDKQGERGYGLEAQCKAITDYLNGGPWELLGQFVEVESIHLILRNDGTVVEASRTSYETEAVARHKGLARLQRCTDGAKAKHVRRLSISP